MHHSKLTQAVPIADTDDLREVCSGMYGGKDAHIEGERMMFSLVRFLASRSSGYVKLNL